MTFKVGLYFLGIGNGKFLKADYIRILATDETEDGVHTLSRTSYACVTVVKGETSDIPA